MESVIKCFDVVNIDLTNKKVYLTRIGAYSDRSFTFQKGDSLNVRNNKIWMAT